MLKPPARHIIVARGGPFYHINTRDAWLLQSIHIICRVRTDDSKYKLVYRNGGQSVDHFRAPVVDPCKSLELHTYLPFHVLSALFLS